MTIIKQWLLNVDIIAFHYFQVMRKIQNTKQLYTKWSKNKNCSNTFNNTCPFTVNYRNATPANEGIPATTTSIVAGCYVGIPPTTSFAGVNLGVASVSGGLSTALSSNGKLLLSVPKPALCSVDVVRELQISPGESWHQNQVGQTWCSSCKFG